MSGAEQNNMDDFILTAKNALGDITIFAHDKTAFLCSQKVPSAAVVKYITGDNRYAMLMSALCRAFIRNWRATYTIYY